MSEPKPRLFTPLFFVMFGFTGTVFLSAFLVLPTTPFRIIELGGSKFAAGLFLGFLTYASAFSAPLTGALADRVGKRRMLLICSFAIASFHTVYGIVHDYRLILGLAFVHGAFWSGLLSASAAYITDIVPESRRAEGIGYWGLSTNIAIVVAPATGLWLLHHGWVWVCAVAAGLNLVMAAIAWQLDDARSPAFLGGERFFTRRLLEWRVLLVSLSLCLYSFGYGGITSFSALYADANQVWPRGIYFITLAVVILATRPLSVPLADRIGHKKVFIPSVLLVVLGLAILGIGGSRPLLLTSAIIFSAGFGTAYPVFVAHVMRHVDPTRRGAAFGGVLAAFDTGIGTGSITVGYLIQHYGFRTAFATAAALSALSVPYFLFAESRFLRPPEGQTLP
ncbi:MAG TPA: MFS transporter [Gemmatimonadales bacterium]|nr:MFS transporter [Gemmatimonadales bacterium]